jgi:beta-galactosidase
LKSDELSDWSTIEVPGHWQLQGYGKPQYTNVLFPFPVDPPFVPSENPTGTYETDFQVPQTWKRDGLLRYRLRFDGVDSAFHVSVNGVDVGYSQGSRNTAEFDITDLIIRGGEGSNTVRVQVYQWSDGSYIEDQDQWWLSGASFHLDHRLTRSSPLRYLSRCPLGCLPSSWAYRRLHNQDGAR